MYLAISIFGFEGRIWNLIVSVPDYCLSFYFTRDRNNETKGVPSCTQKSILCQMVIPNLSSAGLRGWDWSAIMFTL